METEKKTTAKAKTTTKEDSAKKTSAPKTTTKKVEDKAESKPKATKVAEKAVVTDTAVVEKSKAKTTKKENVKLDVKVEDIKKEIETDFKYILHNIQNYNVSVKIKNNSCISIIIYFNQTE